MRKREIARCVKRWLREEEEYEKENLCPFDSGFKSSLTLKFEIKCCKGICQKYFKGLTNQPFPWQDACPCMVYSIKHVIKTAKKIVGDCGGTV